MLVWGSDTGGCVDLFGVVHVHWFGCVCDECVFSRRRVTGPHYVHQADNRSLVSVADLSDSVDCGVAVPGGNAHAHGRRTSWYRHIRHDRERGVVAAAKGHSEARSAHWSLGCVAGMWASVFSLQDVMNGRMYTPAMDMQ